MSKNKKKSSKKNNMPVIRFGTVSPTMLFRAFILFCALVVAVVALLSKHSNTEIWSFLNSVLVYAALTNPKL